MLKYLLPNREKSAQHQQTHLLVNYSLALAFISIAVNLLTNQDIAWTYASGIAFIFLAGLHVYLRRVERVRWVVVALIIMGVSIATLGWFTSGGLLGSARDIFYVTACWSFAVVSYRRHTPLIVTMLIILTGLATLHALFPHWITPYPSASAQFYDLAAATFFSLLLQGLFISTLRRQYDEEHDRLDRVARELAVAKKSAEEALKQRANMIASISHELRGPVASLMAGARLLRTADSTAEKDTLAGFTERAGNNLLRLMDDVLAFRTLETGELAIVKEDFQLENLFKDLNLYFADSLQAKGRRISIKLDKTMPAKANGDFTRINQIILNLVSNAIKYAPEGNITVTATCQPMSPISWLKIAVEDQGPGVPKSLLDNLFQPFGRSVEHRHTIHGHGLGLAVSHLLALKMGGSLTYEEKADPGARFVARIPLQGAANSSGASIYADQQLIGRSFLIVEDDELSSILLQTILSNQGATVEIMANGLEAPGRAMEGAFDLLITDINVPMLDGFEIVKLIRRRESPGNRLPVIAISADSYEVLRKRIIDADIDVWIPKPVNGPELIAKILALCGEKQRPRVNLNPPIPPSVDRDSVHSHQ